MKRSNPTLTLLQATQSSPTLSKLAELALDSKKRWEAIKPLVPTSLHAHIQPGPIDGTIWCLLSSSSSVAAKLRQLLPALQSHLRVMGWNVESIQIKIQSFGGTSFLKQ